MNRQFYLKPQLFVGQCHSCIFYFVIPSFDKVDF